MNKSKEKKAMKPMYVSIACGSEALPQLVEINLQIAINKIKGICKDLQVKAYLCTYLLYYKVKHHKVIIVN